MNYSSQSIVDAIAVARRLTSNHDAERRDAAVHRLVRLSWSDLDPFTRAQNKSMVLNLHRQLSLKHEEELPRMNMVMPSLAGAGRHQLFNNVQL